MDRADAVAARAATDPGVRPLRFRFFGRVRIEPADRRAVEVHGAQPGLILARLILDWPRPVPRDELAELLWPTSLPDHWEGAARHVVSRVRHALVDAGLPRHSLTSAAGMTTLELSGESDVDVSRALASVAAAERVLESGDARAAGPQGIRAFEELRQPFLPTVDGVWVTTWRDRLRTTSQRGLHVAGRAALILGFGTDAADLARRAIQDDPFDEVATRILMRAFEQAGNRARALEAYERLRRLLDDELGVRPSEETERVYRDLLGAAPRTRPGPDLDRRGAPFPTGPFVDRTAELARLDDVWRECLQEGCRVVVVEGDAGIGKTRLVLEAAARMRAHGALVLMARCDPDVAVAYGPLADALEQLLVNRPEIADWMGATASRLAPLVPDVLGEPAERPPASPEQATAQLFRAVARALAEAAREPLLVVLDDLQWADRDTLALLRHLAGRLDRSPCLFVLVLRESSALVADALTAVDRLVPTITLRLRGLAADDVAELLARSGIRLNGDERGVAATVAARTAGNPLYVTQLLLDAQASGRPLDPQAVPEAATQLLERRLASLDAELVSTLVLAAVAGPLVQLHTLEACSTLPSDALLDALEALCRERLLEEHGAGTFAFVHELVREAVLSSVGATRRARLHARVADALITAGAEPAVIAHHLVHADSRAAAAAVGWSQIAGHAALARAGWASAEEHFADADRMAVDVETRCEALVGLSRARRGLGDVTGARVAVSAGLALAREHHLPRATAAAALALVGGGGRGVATDLSDAERAAVLRAALDGLAADDADLLIPTLAELALTLVLTDAVDERRDLCERCLELARRRDEPAGLATALWARRIALMGPRGTNVRVTDGREAAALPASAVPPESRIAAQLGLVEDLLELGERDAATAVLDDADRLAREIDHPYWRWASSCWRTLDAIIDGRCALAEQLARDALENQAPHDHPEAQATLGVHLVDIRLLQGRAHEAVPLVAAAADAYPHIAAYRGTLALCLLEAGDVAGARVAYRTFAERAFELPPDSNWLLGIVALADTAAVLGEPGEAATLYEQLEPWAGRQVVLNCYGGGGAYWGPVTHHLGLLAARRGDRPAAGDLLHRAVDDSEAFRAPLFATRSRAALAALAYGRPGP